MMYRVCVIGSGDRGSAHASTWVARGDADIVSVCDIDESRVKIHADTYNAAPYADFRDALGHAGIDVVSVCVPTYLHAPVIVEAANRGIHIMAEKPLALTLDQAKDIEAALENNDVVYSACFQHRDRILYQKLRRFVADRKFGTPLHFRFTDIRDVRPKPAMHRKSQNGGVIIDMACHMFDMLRFLTGDEITRVYATGDVFGRGKPTLESVDDFAIDAAQIELTTHNGHHGSLYINWGMPEGYSGRTNGAELLGPLGGAREAPGEIILTMGDHTERWPDSEPGTKVRIDRFIEAVEGKSTLDVTYRDARITLELSLAALESIRTGKAVDYDPYASSS